MQDVHVFIDLDRLCNSSFSMEGKVFKWYFKMLLAGMSHTDAVRYEAAGAE